MVEVTVMSSCTETEVLGVTEQLTALDLWKTNDTWTSTTLVNQN